MPKSFILLALARLISFSSVHWSLRNCRSVTQQEIPYEPVMRKPTTCVPTRFDTNRAVQSQEMG